MTSFLSHYGMCAVLRLTESPHCMHSYEFRVNLVAIFKGGVLFLWFSCNTLSYLYICVVFSKSFFVYTGMEKINFSGGEPFIHKKGAFVGDLVQYCKKTLELPSVSIVSNGSLINEEWFDKYGKQ